MLSNFYGGGFVEFGSDSMEAWGLFLFTHLSFCLVFFGGGVFSFVGLGFSEGFLDLLQHEASVVRLVKLSLSNSICVFLSLIRFIILFWIIPSWFSCLWGFGYICINCYDKRIFDKIPCFQVGYIFCMFYFQSFFFFLQSFFHISHSCESTARFCLQFTQFPSCLQSFMVHSDFSAVYSLS